jgi:hypothetical protein
MKIVKQVFAGWIGIADDEIVDNGSIVFTLDYHRSQQLKEYEPTERELKELHQRMIESKSKYADYVGGLICSRLS